MNSRPPPTDIDRFRGWTLIALYAALTVFSLMLLYVLYLAQSELTASTLTIYGMGISCIASALFNAWTTVRHFNIIRSGTELPRLALKPFLFMAIALTFAGQVFQGF
ncbi:MAG: hypothetical protein COB37_05170 [Kordiimonadales bacterium]|nr:MAG: hypothetical protein COB37_05170 [Kordiimonadales bacterium]